MATSSSVLPQRQRLRHHLYVVFDDWEWGFSIRKLDLYKQMMEERQLDETARPPPPAIFRVEAPQGLFLHFAAFGTKIVAMHPRGHEKDELHPLVLKRFLSVFDVKSRTVFRGPRPVKNAESLSATPMYIDVVDDDRRRLFALGDYTWDVLEEESDGGWAWKRLGAAPFTDGGVYSYAVHPVGPTIMVTYAYPGLVGPTTVTFDVNGSSQQWQRYGDGDKKFLHLPFAGRAHHVPELGGWVGMALAPYKYGHVVLCSLPSVDESSPATRTSELNVKVSKEMVISPDCGIKFVLFYMGSADGGSSSQFCVFQPLPKRELFRVNTFSLKLDADGELTTANTSRVRFYRTPDGASIPHYFGYPVRAFLM